MHAKIAGNRGDGHFLLIAQLQNTSLTRGQFLLSGLAEVPAKTLQPKRIVFSVFAEPDRHIANPSLLRVSKGVFFMFVITPVVVSGS